MPFTMPSPIGSFLPQPHNDVNSFLQFIAQQGQAEPETETPDDFLSFIEAEEEKAKEQKPRPYRFFPHQKPPSETPLGKAWESITHNMPRKAYWEQALRPEYRKQFGKSVIGGLKGLAEFATTPFMAGPRAAEQLAQAEIQKRIAEKQGVPPEPARPITERLKEIPAAVGKTVESFITFVPKTLIEFISNPVETIRDKPVDVAMVITGTGLGKSIIGKIKGGQKLSTPEMGEALNRAQKYINELPGEIAEKMALEQPEFYLKKAKKISPKLLPGEIAEELVARREAGKKITKKELEQIMVDYKKEKQPIMEPGLTVEYMPPEKAGAAEHAGGAGWSPEALARARNVEYYVYDVRTKDFRPLGGVDAADVQPHKFEVIYQRNKNTGKIESVDYGSEATPIPEYEARLKSFISETPEQVGLSIKRVTPEEAQKMIAEYRAKKGIKKPAPLEIATEVPTDFFDKITYAIDRAKIARKEQEKIYSNIRGKRFTEAAAVGKAIPGEAGYYAQLEKLKGPLDKVEFDSLKNLISQEDFNRGFQLIEDSPHLAGMDKISAKNGWARLWAASEEPGPPQARQIEHLSAVFPQEVIGKILSKRPLLKKMGSLGFELVSMQKAYMATLDFSRTLRQDIMMAFRHPIYTVRALGRQFKYFRRDKDIKILMDDITSRPNYELAKDSKLDIMNPFGPALAREEQYQSTLAEKIPITGPVVKASNRAFTGGANKLRMDVFDRLIKVAKKQDLDVRAVQPRRFLGKLITGKPLAEDIATVVNNMTGRGGLPAALERSAAALGFGLFSPRLWASRLNAINPIYYIKLSPFARREALSGLLSLVGGGLTVLGLAKLAGLEVGTNRLSSDFGKIKVGNTRIDIWGGNQQNVRVLCQLFEQKTVSSTTGKVTKLGKGFKPLTSLDLITRILESKSSPALTFALGMLKGKTFLGEKFNIPRELGQRYVPMILQDLVDIAKDDPDLIPLSVLGVFGAGLQTYGPYTTKKKPWMWSE